MEEVERITLTKEEIAMEGLRRAVEYLRIIAKKESDECRKKEIEHFAEIIEAHKRLIEY